MQNKSEHTSVVTTVTPKNARHSPRNGFNAYIVLSPVTGLSCHRRRRSCLRRLDSSVGASGPHDFAVRSRHHSSTDVACVHCIPLPTFVTTAKRPSYRVRDGENVPVICGQDQLTPPAAEWHDGQIAYGGYVRSARRAKSVGPSGFRKRSTDPKGFPIPPYGSSALLVLLGSGGLRLRSSAGRALARPLANPYHGPAA